MYRWVNFAGRRHHFITVTGLFHKSVGRWNKIKTKSKGLNVLEVTRSISKGNMNKGTNQGRWIYYWRRIIERKKERNVCKKYVMPISVAAVMIMVPMTNVRQKSDFSLKERDVSVVIRNIRALSMRCLLFVYN